jgi:creatinine amidohydrolase/Fe(II)-dependent formamide hydrolase-like protein
MPIRPVEEMLPGDVIAARERYPYALVPVSPMVEWHSWHLPLSTDGIIAESLCALVAERLGGVHYRTLPLGLDAWRTPSELEAWGFAPGDQVFGMRFPGLPISSEYCEIPHMRDLVSNRLAHIRASGFEGACIVNAHGGVPQHPTLKAIAAEWDQPGFRVAAVSVFQLPNRFKHERLRIGGHAGLSETHWVLAFRPELVDLTRLPEGRLSVRHDGILHGHPTIEAEHNPRNALMAVAHQLRESLIESLVDCLQATMSGKPGAGAVQAGARTA